MEYSTEKSREVPRNLDQVSLENKVLRLAREPKDYQKKGSISAIELSSEFELSTEDKKSTPPHLSVWVESYTKPEEAYRFLLKNNPDSKRKLVLYLSVSEIHEIIGRVGDEDIYHNLLNVLFIHIGNLESGQAKSNYQAILGHAGITGLDVNNNEGKTSQLSKRDASNLRKDLRAKLARIASKNCHLLEDNQ